MQILLLQPFNGLLSGTTQVSQYQKKHSLTHTYRDCQPSFISFLHLLRSMVPSLINLRAWQAFCTTSLPVFFSLPLGLAPSTSYPYISSSNHCLLFATHAHTMTMCFSVVPRLCHLILVSLSQLFTWNVSFTLTPHIHLTILISARWSDTSFSFLTGQVPLPWNILLCTQLLSCLPLIFNDASILVSNGTNCLNLFQPIQILASTAASASPSTPILSPKKQNLSTNSRFALAPNQHLCELWLLDSSNLYKKITSSLCTCYPLPYRTLPYPRGGVQ